MKLCTHNNKVSLQVTKNVKCNVCNKKLMIAQ